MFEKVDSALEELGDAERQRDAALQETVYLRARLAILENESRAELSDLDREKIMELEDYLATSQHGKRLAESQVQELENNLHRLASDLDMWKANGDAASDRAQLAEEKERSMRLQLNSAQTQTSRLEMQLREQVAENAAHSSNLQQRALDLESHEKEGANLRKERSTHLLVIEQTRSALSAAEQRSEDLARRCDTATDRAQRLERELEETKAHLAEQKQAAAGALQRATEADVNVHTIRTQLEHYRRLAEGGFNQLLSVEQSAERSLSSQRADNPEKSAALSQECASLHKMLNEAGTQIEAAQTSLMRHRQDLEESRASAAKLETELKACQRQRSIDTETISNLQQSSASRSGEQQKLRDEISHLKLRCDLLRRLLSDHGISASDNAAEPISHGSSTKQMQEQSEEQARTLETMRMELERVQNLLIEKQGNTGQSSQISSGPPDAHSDHPKGTASNTASNEVRELEIRMAEMETTHKKKLQQVEADYQTAVRYVKWVYMRNRNCV